MADGNPRELEARPNNVPPPPASTIEYRRFLQSALPVAASLSILIGNLYYPPQASSTEAPPKPPSVILSDAITHPNLAEAEQEKTRVIEEKLKISIAEELKRYINDPERIQRTLSWKNMIEQIVKDPRLGIKEGDREYWLNTMLEIIFVESGGNQNARSSVAYGLTQLRMETARQIATQYKIPKYNLYNGWDNIFLGLAHQINMEKLYGRELARWIHHLGMGNGTQAIITYLISVEKLPVSEVERTFEDPTNQLLRQYIEKYHISPARLLMSPAVTAKLKEINALNDDTQYYPARLKAAGEAMNLSQTKAQSLS